MNKQRLGRALTMTAKIVFCIVVSLLITVKWTNTFAHFVIAPTLAHLNGDLGSGLSMTRFIAIMTSYLVALGAMLWAALWIGLRLVSRVSGRFFRCEVAE